MCVWVPNLYAYYIFNSYYCIVMLIAHIWNNKIMVYHNTQKMNFFLSFYEKLIRLTNHVKVYSFYMEKFLSTMHSNFNIRNVWCTQKLHYAFPLNIYARHDILFVYSCVIMIISKHEPWYALKPRNIHGRRKIQKSGGWEATTVPTLYPFRRPC